MHLSLARAARHLAHRERWPEARFVGGVFLVGGGCFFFEEGSD